MTGGRDDTKRGRPPRPQGFRDGRTGGEVAAQVRVVSRTRLIATAARLWVTAAVAAGAIGGTAGFPIYGTVIGVLGSTVAGLPPAALATVALVVATRRDISWRTYAITLQVITAALVLFAVGASVAVVRALLAHPLDDVVSQTHVGPVTVAAAVVLLLLADLRLLTTIPRPGGRDDRRWIGVVAAVGLPALLCLAVLGERTVFGQEIRRHRAADGAVTLAVDTLGAEPASRISTRAGTMNDMGCGTAALARIDVGDVALALLGDRLASDGWTVRQGSTGDSTATWLAADRGEVRLTAEATEHDVTLVAEAGCDRSGPLGPR